MSLHVAPDDEWLIGGVPDQTTVPGIEDVADAAGFVLSTDQKEFFQDLVERGYAFQDCFASPGGSKSFCGTMYATARSQQLGKRGIIVWITPTRGARYKQLGTFRRTLRDPLLAGSLGRPSATEAGQEGEREWEVDSELGAVLENTPASL